MTRQLNLLQWSSTTVLHDVKATQYVAYTVYMVWKAKMKNHLSIRFQAIKLHPHVFHKTLLPITHTSFMTFMSSDKYEVEKWDQ